MLRRLIGLLLLFAAMPATATWRVAETPHFRIHSEASEPRLRQQAAILEDYHKLLQLLTSRKWPADAPKLDVYMVGGTGSLRVVAPGISSTVLGFYRPTDVGIVALAVDGGHGSDWMSGLEVLLHEYAHHFMYQTGGAGLPPWYVEGFAEYLMTADFLPDRVEWGEFNKARAYSLLTEPWLPLERLVANAPRLRPSDMGAFYAQSWLLAHYLFRGDGMQPKLTAYLRRVASGEDSATAFKAEIAPDLKEFERQLRAYMNGRRMTFSRMTRVPAAPADIRITQLPPAADEALLPLVSVQLPQTPETDTANLTRIRKAAGRYPDDPWMRRALAIAEAVAHGGSQAEAARRLDDLLAASPDDALLLRTRARVHMLDEARPLAERRSAARRLLARGFRAAPNDWQLLYAYVLTFDPHEAPLPSSVVDVAVRANALAPQVPGLALATGTALIQARRFDEAHAVMAPVVLSLHGQPASEPMRALLAALRTGVAAQVDAAVAALNSPAADARPGDTEEPAAQPADAPR